MPKIRRIFSILNPHFNLSTHLKNIEQQQRRIFYLRANYFFTHLQIQSIASCKPVASNAEHACICQSRSFNFTKPISSATSDAFNALERSCLLAKTIIGTLFNFSSFNSSLNSSVLSPIRFLSLLSTYRMVELKLEQFSETSLSKMWKTYHKNKHICVLKVIFPIRSNLRISTYDKKRWNRHWKYISRFIYLPKSHTFRFKLFDDIDLMLKPAVAVVMWGVSSLASCFKIVVFPELSTEGWVLLNKVYGQNQEHSITYPNQRE